MTRKQAFEHGKKQLQKPEERDCEHCIHHKDNGCESWECHFERRTADIELIVKIDADVYARLFDNGIQDNEIATDDICEMARALRLGKPLPEHHGDLIDRTELLKQYGLENATKYGNKDAEQQKHSYSTMMMYEIADMIEDAETIIPAKEEGE